VVVPARTTKRTTQRHTFRNASITGLVKEINFADWLLAVFGKINFYETYIELQNTSEHATDRMLTKAVKTQRQRNLIPALPEEREAYQNATGKAIKHL